MNKLAVLVLKWCDGSYLEDQDKFRMSVFSVMCICFSDPQNMSGIILLPHLLILMKTGRKWK
ncbi:MAG: hypothetical protein ACLUOI_07310 [Eisenbergiella sp.]